MSKIPNGWSKNKDELVYIMKAQDFVRALALLNAIGDIAQKQNHHPNMTIQNYNELVITTTSHDADGLTEKDYKLAQAITELIEYQIEKQNIEQNGR